MAKRITAGILGTIAAVTSLLPLEFAFEILKDFKNPDVAFWSNVLGELFMCSLAVGGLSIGIHFLRFAASGRTRQTDSWVQPTLLGIGFFFPAFVLSLPLTILLLTRTWPGDNGKVDLALEVSLCVGVVAAVICTVLLLRKRAAAHTS
jgi:hypothetical protein